MFIKNIIFDRTPTTFNFVIGSM